MLHQIYRIEHHINFTNTFRPYLENGIRWSLSPSLDWIFCHKCLCWFFVAFLSLVTESFFLNRAEINSIHQYGSQMHVSTSVSHRFSDSGVNAIDSHTVWKRIKRVNIRISLVGMSVDCRLNTKMNYKNHLNKTFSQPLSYNPYTFHYVRRICVGLWILWHAIQIFDMPHGIWWFRHTAFRCTTHTHTHTLIVWWLLFGRVYFIFNLDSRIE